MKTLILLFHPSIATSTVNRRLIKAAEETKEIKIRDMYQLYPDFTIDAEAEKQELEAAERIVLQFPMYWYSSPALLKQWQDVVLEYGWAYGSNGDKLQGKDLLIAVTPGAPAENYVHEDKFNYTVTDLLPPFQATSNLIGTRFVKPFIAAGASSMPAAELEIKAKEYAEYLAQEQLELLGNYE